MVKFIISNFINNLSASATDKLEQFVAFLKSNNLGFKDYLDEGLIIVYNQYDKVSKSDLEKECRSIIFDRNTLEIICYSFDDPIYNKDATHMLINKENESLICQCYEGTILSVYNHNNVWYASTRRMLDSKQSFWNQHSKSHYVLMEECLNVAGYESFQKFTNNLLPTFCYHFVLIHHENKNYVDYSNMWGLEYKKLVLVLLRNKTTQQEVNLYDNVEQYFVNNVLDNTIFISEQYSDFSVLEKENNKNNVDIPAKNEGLIVKIYNNETEKYNILKFQTVDYSFAKITNNEKNIFRGFIKLYQIDELTTYLSTNKVFEQYKKIRDPKTNRDYDVIGIVDAVIKLCSSELYDLFNYFWNIKSGEKKNVDKYEIIPKEYKSMLFHVRGLFFNKKAEYISNKKNNINIKSELSINDIYDSLKKKIDVGSIINFLKVRNHFMNNLGKSLYDESMNKIKDKKLELTQLYVDMLINEEIS